jgi:hypothetical protein
MDSMDNFRERFEALEQQLIVMGTQTRPVERRRWWPIAWPVAVVAALGLALGLPLSVQAETFRCGAGDVPCLIAAINEANANGTKNTIRLEAGTYTLTAPDNFFVGSNGLPVITSPLTITGRGAETTIIERADNPPGFRILQVATAGTLTLKRLTLRGGTAITNEGGGILNRGTLTLLHTTVTDNFASVGAGISTRGGTVTIMHSIIANNGGGIVGGLAIDGGTVTLHATTVTRNFAQGIGGIANGFLGAAGGTVIITESAITDNIVDLPAPAGIFNDGTMVITNTTITGNINPLFPAGSRFGGSGIENEGGTLLVTNSTVAGNISLFRWRRRYYSDRRHRAPPEHDPRPE